jgi:drug/metabolite transporter (DMT)-like permease
MTALKTLAALALLAGVLLEVFGRHPGGYGFAGNAGAVLAVVFWALSSLRQRSAEEGKGR